jgi:hypothetical protein
VTATSDSRPGTPMHDCVGVLGMRIPYAPSGESSKVTMHAREDYVRDEDVQRDTEGRVWMSATVTTDHGEHLAVYAPTAHAGATEG